MNENDRRKVQKGENPEANRRLFLQRMAGLGIGSLAGGTALMGKAEAQPTEGRLRRQGAGGRRGRRRPRPGRAADVSKYRDAFEAIKKTGTAGDEPSAEWRNALDGQGLTSMDCVAAVVTLEVSQRLPGCHDIAGKIADLARLTATGMIASGQLPSSGGIPEPSQSEGPDDDMWQGVLCGRGCGTGDGGICGGGCGTAGGGLCGGNCTGRTKKKKAGDAFVVDVMGDAISSGDFTSPYPLDVAVALDNAAQAYLQVFPETAAKGAATP